MRHAATRHQTVPNVADSMNSSVELGYLARDSDRKKRRNVTIAGFVRPGIARKWGDS
ncbi:hypothetical protein PDO_2988 [Rhizobium sp. PDO1-076]|nr:hypothetical protein PDO_2988 [Rhizobium sp. PDO1-076]